MRDNYKKTADKNNKKNISFIEKVALYDEYEKLVSDDIYPLILLLSDKEAGYLYDKYYEDFIPNIPKQENTNYMKINIKKINVDFINDRIFLDKYIRNDGSILFIHGLFYDDEEDLHSSLCFVPKRGLFVKGGSRKDSEELANLEFNAFQRYLDDPNRPKVKTIK